MLSHLFTGTLLIGTLHFICVALGVGVLLLPLTALLGFVYWRLIRPDERGAAGHRALVITVGAGTVVGTAGAWLAGLQGMEAWVWISPPLGTLLASAMFSMAYAGQDGICQLCKQPAPSAAGFQCPRCHDRVCARPSCWNARYLRCTRCHEREIVALPVHESWWAARVGRRLARGECTHCYLEAHDADLRECGQCRWPLCRRCWDHHNGVCQHCHWVIPNLPPALAVLVQTAAAARGRAAPVSPPNRPRPRPVGPAAPAPAQGPHSPAQAPRGGAPHGPGAGHPAASGHAAPAPARARSHGTGPELPVERPARPYRPRRPPSA